jgi:hypothetical protein
MAAISAAATRSSEPINDVQAKKLSHAGFISVVKHCRPETAYELVRL